MRALTMLLWLGLSALPAASKGTVSMELHRLTWLEGIWIGTSGGVEMEEHWSSPAGGCLIGMHKDTKGGRMVSFEFFRIVSTDDNRVCYLASPKGAPATSFCAIEMNDSKVVFENRHHDFPQRILYWLDESARLHARIEGTAGGASRSEEWVWSRRTGG